MKKLFVLSLGIVLALSSCSKDKHTGGPDGPGADQVLVDMSFIAEGGPASRALPTSDRDQIAIGTTSERMINTLDLLVFKGDQFQYRRHATKYGSDNLSFRATMKVDQGLTVYFVANRRTLIESLIANNSLVDGSNASWATVRALLLETDPERFSKDNATAGTTAAQELSNLPMWGYASGLNVTEGSIEHWGGIRLLRGVAGVDVYVEQSITDFDLTQVYVYFVPNTGSIAPLDKAYVDSSTDLYTTIESKAPTGMRTNIEYLGPITAETWTDATTKAYKRVAHKFYFYDNDTDEATYDRTTNNRRYTRVIVGGEYRGTLYYYPIDFMEDYVDASGTTRVRYKKIKRNAKSVMVITDVTGPGYPTPGEASENPPVNINTEIISWNVDETGSGHAGYDGTYFVYIARNYMYVSRPAGSTDEVRFNAYTDYEGTRNNVPSSLVELAFKDAHNGAQSVYPATGTATGIQNDRFIVEKVVDATGALVGLKVTAKGEYSETTATLNTDIYTVTVGRLKWEVNITQVEGSSSDWLNGGRQDETLG